MQSCNRCGQQKEPGEFSDRGAKKQPWCKECNRAYARQYYKDNNAKLKKDLYKLRLLRVAANKRYMIDYLASHSCIDCGEKDPVVLEFDHVRGVKKDVMSTLVTQGYSLKTIAAEIDKCEVVCANCHRRRTALRGGFYKTKNI
jgi:hypothetical protein